jgi:hypothetical protein
MANREPQALVHSGDELTTVGESCGGMSQGCKTAEADRLLPMRETARPSLLTEERHA